MGVMSLLRLMDEYEVGAGVNKSNFKVNFVLGKTAVALPFEEVGYVLQQLYLAYCRTSKYVLLEVVHPDNFKFFMNFKSDDILPDTSYAAKTFDAFEDAELKYSRHSLTVITLVGEKSISLRFIYLNVTQNQCLELVAQIEKHLCRVHLSHWDRDIYADRVKTLQIPYASSTGFNKVVSNLYKYRVGERAIASKSATHFNKQYCECRHLALDKNGCDFLHDNIVHGHAIGRELYFNEFIANNEIIFFIECDAQSPIGVDIIEIARIFQTIIASLCKQSRVILFCASKATRVSHHFRFVDIKVSVEEAGALTTLVRNHVANILVKNSIDSHPSSGSIVQLRMPFCDKIDKKGVRSFRPLRCKGILINGVFTEHKTGYDLKILRMSVLQQNVQTGSRLKLCSHSDLRFGLEICPSDGEFRVLRDFSMLDKESFMYYIRIILTDTFCPNF